MKKIGKTILITSLILTMTACSSLYNVNADTENYENSQEEMGSQTLPYAIVDTGQVIFYDDTTEIDEPLEGEPFYGQDAQYQGNQFDYTSIVYDNGTGLTWTQSVDINKDGEANVDDKLTYSEALAYVDTMNEQNYGGYNDWRVPSMKQLYSLMSFEGVDPPGPQTEESTAIPFIHTDYFENGFGDTDAGERHIDGQVWSSNAYGGTVFGGLEGTFGLNLVDGRIKCYPTNSPMREHVNYVLFVRGNVEYGTNDFVDNNDGTISDNATGLMWTQDDSGEGMNWEEALAWAEEANANNYLGYSDWRLPNAKEMQSILDYSKAPDTGSPAIDPIFSITEITNENGDVDYPWYWTGTTHASTNNDGTKGVYICFGRAMGYMGESWTDLHGAGAQRSDYKSGDLATMDEVEYVDYGYHISGSDGQGQADMGREEGGMTPPDGAPERGMTPPDGAPEGDMEQGGGAMMTPEDAIRIDNYVRLVRDID